MKWRPVIITGVILGMGGIAYAGYRYFIKEKNLLSDYKIEPIAFQFIKTTPDQWVVAFTLRFTNKSAIEATIKKVFTNIYIKDVFIGYVVNDNPVIIPGNGSSDIKLQFSFSPAIVLQNAVDLILGAITTKDISYRVEGYVDLQSGFVPVEVPFDNSGKLSDFL